MVLNAKTIEKVSYNLSLPKKEYSSIRNIASTEGCSANYLINKAIKDYLKNYKGA